MHCRQKTITYISLWRVLELVPFLCKLLFRKISINMKWDTTNHPITEETSMSSQRCMTRELE